MTFEPMSKMWGRYWLRQVALAKEFNMSNRAAAICMMNMVCYEAQEWAGARK